MKVRGGPGIILIKGIPIPDFFVQGPARKFPSKGPIPPTEIRGLAGLAGGLQPGPVIACRLATAGTRRAPERAFTGPFGRLNIGND